MAVRCVLGGKLWMQSGVGFLNVEGKLATTL